MIIKKFIEFHNITELSINPKHRLAALQTGNSSPLKLVASYCTEYAYEVEKTMHRKYFHLRQEGEWFYMSIENEVNFLEECRKIEDNIRFLKSNEAAFI